MSICLTPKARLEALLALVNSAAQDAIAEYEKTGDVPSTETAHALDNTVSSLGLRKAVRILEGACEQLCTTLAPPRHTLHIVSTLIHVVQIISNFVAVIASVRTFITSPHA